MAQCPMTSTWQYDFFHTCIEKGTGIKEIVNYTLNVRSKCSEKEKQCSLHTATQRAIGARVRAPVCTLLRFVVIAPLRRAA